MSFSLLWGPSGAEETLASEEPGESKVSAQVGRFCQIRKAFYSCSLTPGLLRSCHFSLPLSLALSVTFFHLRHSRPSGHTHCLRFVLHKPLSIVIMLILTPDSLPPFLFWKLPLFKDNVHSSSHIPLLCPSSLAPSSSSFSLFSIYPHNPLSSSSFLPPCPPLLSSAASWSRKTPVLHVRRTWIFLRKMLQPQMNNLLIFKMGQ